MANFDPLLIDSIQGRTDGVKKSGDVAVGVKPPNIGMAIITDKELDRAAGIHPLGGGVCAPRVGIDVYQDVVLVKIE